MLHVLRQISMAPESADLGPVVVLALQWGSSLFVALCFAVWTARGLWRIAKASLRAAADQQPRRADHSAGVSFR
jgi:hypothetical protein